MVGFDSDWRRCFGKTTPFLRRIVGLGLGLGLSGCTAGGPSPESSTPERAAGLPGAIRLVGLDGGALEGLLGRPTLVRSERQAQYWRYSLGECQLDLFLYAEASRCPSRVIYLDVRPSGYASLSEAAMCGDLAALLRGEPVPPRSDRAESIGLPASPR